MTTLRRWIDGPAFATIRVGTVIAAWVLWAWDATLWWPMLVAALPLVIQLIAGRFPYRPVSVNVILLIFMLSAGVGLWAGYDRGGDLGVFGNALGWQKLWGLLLAVLLYWALAAARDAQALRWSLILLVGLGLVVAVVFIATNDWTLEGNNWGPAAALGQAIQSLLPSLPRGGLNANVAAGIVAPLIPLGLGLVGEARKRCAGLWVAGGVGAVGVMILALALSLSRWTMISVIAAGALVVAWRVAGRWGQRQTFVFSAIVIGGAIGGALVLLGVPGLREVVLNSYAVSNRLSLFYQGALLARDYFFTGCGLGNFALVHSTYSLLIHVPVIPHSHLLLLNVVIEQGIVGALAVVAVWGRVGWSGLRRLGKAEASRPFLAAGLISLFILFAHGLADDGLYATRGVLLLWMPVGVVVGALRSHEEASFAAMTRRRGVALAGISMVALLALLLFWRPLGAMWYADLGAVVQTQAELPIYDPNHFDDPDLDEVRRTVDLSAAVAHFERALALDSGQVTARTRLAQIALGRGEYETALVHAQAAWDAGHRDRVTRLILGDALVANGRVQEAIETVQGLEHASGRMSFQAFYRYTRGGDWQRVAWAWRAVAVLYPEHYSRAIRNAEEAEARIGRE